MIEGVSSLAAQLEAVALSETDGLGECEINPFKSGAFDYTRAGISRQVHTRWDILEAGCVEPLEACMWSGPIRVADHIGAWAGRARPEDP